MPSATMTSVWNRPQRKRSSRAGMSVSMSVVPASPAPAGTTEAAVASAIAAQDTPCDSFAVEGAPSTSYPFSIHASMPPPSGRTRLKPARMSFLATTAALASLGQSQ